MNKIVSPDGFGAPWTPADFEAAIRAVGLSAITTSIRFIRLLHGGKLNKGQVQAWALNRYCYQEGGAAQGRGLHEPRARSRTASRMDPSHSRP